MTDITNYVTIAVGGLFLLLFMASMVTGKIIGVESIAVAQFAFLSLMVVKDQPPTFAALKSGIVVCIYVPLLGEGDPSLNV